jgi:hypothetical protein
MGRGFEKRKSSFLRTQKNWLVTSAEASDAKNATKVAILSALNSCSRDKPLEIFIIMQNYLFACFVQSERLASGHREELQLTVQTCKSPTLLFSYRTVRVVQQISHINLSYAMSAYGGASRGL